MATYYEVDQSFYAVVRETRIMFGNPKLLGMPCVDIDVIEDLIFINNVSHHSSCNITNDLENGENGTIKMLKTAICFAKQMFPHCSQIELSDSSGYIDRNTGRSINLPDKYMFLYKQTWYQKHFPMFKFKPKDTRARSRTRQFLSRLHQKPTKKECIAIGIRHESQTLFDGIAEIQDDVYGIIQKAMYVYGIPSFNGMPFIGTVPTELAKVPYKKINKPQPLKAQWGGMANKHFRHVTWIE
jgi:hypothetical protein